MTAGEILALVLASSGLFSVILAILNRFWKKKDDKVNGIAELREEIKKVLDILNEHIREDRENDIRMARRDILRFNDEIRRGQEHTAESFDDILEQIDIYERYCSAHPDFENNKAVMATENIKRVYRIRMEKNDFL